MAREISSNRFINAGKALVNSGGITDKQEKPIEKDIKKKDKVISAKVYPDTWNKFVAINKSRGMTNNSVINMLISDYVRSQNEILK